MLDNKYSTINKQLLEQYKHSLREILSIMLYTDTNKLRSIFRQAFWSNSSLNMRNEFYWWTINMYKTFSYHAEPLPRFSVQELNPMKIYHGINKYFRPVSKLITKIVHRTYIAEENDIEILKKHYGILDNLIKHKLNCNSHHAYINDTCQAFCNHYINKFFNTLKSIINKINIIFETQLSTEQEVIMNKHLFETPEYDILTGTYRFKNTYSPYINSDRSISNSLLITVSVGMIQTKSEFYGSNQHAQFFMDNICRMILISIFTFHSMIVLMGYLTCQTGNALLLKCGQTMNMGIAFSELVTRNIVKVNLSNGSCAVSLQIIKKYLRRQKHRDYFYFRIASYLFVNWTFYQLKIRQSCNWTFQLNLEQCNLFCCNIFISLFKAVATGTCHIKSLYMGKGAVVKLFVCF
eukprot:249148_1